MQTGPATIRFPDVSVYCRDTPPPADPHPKLLGDPKTVIEILSPSTASNDQITKLAEYRARPGVEQVIFIDPVAERVRIVAARSPEGSDADWLVAGSDVPLVSLGIAIALRDMIAEDLGSVSPLGLLRCARNDEIRFMRQPVRPSATKQSGDVEHVMPPPSWAFDLAGEAIRLCSTQSAILLQRQMRFQ